MLPSARHWQRKLSNCIWLASLKSPRRFCATTSKSPPNRLSAPPCARTWPDRAADREQFPFPFDLGLANGGFQGPGLGGGIPFAEIPKDQAELVAPKPRHRVRGAHVVLQHGGDGLEHDIARQIAVPVIDRLEAIEVDVEQRRARAVPFHVGERARELPVEAAPVEDLGDRVNVRGCLELLHL